MSPMPNEQEPVPQSAQAAANPAGVEAARKPREPRSASARGSRGVVIVAGLLAGCVAAFISWFFLGESLAALGIPDPGRITTIGLPLIRAAAWVAMATAVGSFLVSSFLVSPNTAAVGGNENLIKAPLTVDGHIASQTATSAAWVTAALSLIEIPLVMSDLTGTPLSGVFNPTMMGLAFGSIPAARAWAVTAVIAALVGIGGIVGKKWASQPLLLVASLAMIIPLGMQGHSAAGGDHDFGTNSFLWHLTFMVLWLGGLIGLLAHGRRLGPDLPLAVRRYSFIALVCLIVMAISGLINAAVRIEFSDWFSTRYGLIIVAKVTLTIILALFGFAHRQLTIPQLEKNPALFRRVAFVEILVLAATVGVAGTMGRTPPPPPRNPDLNSMQLLVGYELADAPTARVLFTSFRFDIFFSTVGLLLFGFYVCALVRLYRRGLSWPLARTLWWAAGTLGLAWFMSSGFGMYIPVAYDMHMVGHMVLSMALPLFMVLGAPLTLLMEAFEPAQEG